MMETYPKWLMDAACKPPLREYSGPAATFTNPGQSKLIQVNPAKKEKFLWAHGKKWLDAAVPIHPKWTMDSARVFVAAAATSCLSWCSGL